MDTDLIGRRNVLAGLAASIIGGLLCASSARAVASINPFLGNSTAIEEGAARFRTSCSLCHGLHADGGSRGPDLTRGKWIHGGNDPDIFRTITEGVPGTLMTANELSDSETWAIISYLRSVAPKTIDILTGDPKLGENLFNGTVGCSQCHMVNGKGGRLGPDLSRIGSARSPKYLARKLRQPNDALAQGLEDAGMEWPLQYQMVKVVTKKGQTFAGVLRNEDAFSIQFMDLTETLRLFLKRDLQLVTHNHTTPMPAFGEDALDESKLQDLLAYLNSLQGPPAP